MAKNFFDQPTVKVLDDINIVKNADQVNFDGRSLMEQQKQAEERIEKARGVEEREDALESYLSGQLGNFFENRNVKLNMENVGRSITDGTPEGLKNIFKTMFEEGRGKKKKVLRMLLPLLLGLKVKFASVIGLVYLGVILLAKKALVMALISIAISVFQLVKKMMHHGEAYPPHGYNPGWQSHIDVGHVEYAPQSSTVGQNLAYGGQKNSRR
ncbi:DUF1676 domain-containing protein Osi6 [Arctopsyche grandis]|uniref:DUF1676 domain-containing protein Osi6 n=1 Tax=Arctopsyche grandis TaxID=121162 RepID=UPI00406D78EF